VERVYKAPVGSSAYEIVPWEATCILQSLQPIERYQKDQESKARSSIRSRTLSVRKREHTDSVDSSVQGVRTPFCHNTGR